MKGNRQGFLSCSITRRSGGPDFSRGPGRTQCAARPPCPELTVVLHPFCVMETGQIWAGFSLFLKMLHVFMQYYPHIKRIGQAACPK